MKRSCNLLRYKVRKLPSCRPDTASDGASADAPLAGFPVSFADNSRRLVAEAIFAIPLGSRPADSYRKQIKPGMVTGTTPLTCSVK